MARPSEHNIESECWKAPSDISMYSLNDYVVMHNAFQSVFLQYNDIYICYCDVQKSCYDYLLNFQDAYTKLFDFLQKPENQISISNPRYHQLNEDFNNLYSAVIKDGEKRKDIIARQFSTVLPLKELSIIEFIRFLETYMQFNCTSEKRIREIFQDEFIEHAKNKYKIKHFENNRNKNRSDTVILFNFAMLLTLDKNVSKIKSILEEKEIKTVQKVPLQILSPDASEHIYNGYSDNDTLLNQFDLIFNNLLNYSLSHSPFSQDLIEATLFFSSISARKEQAKENLKTCQNILEIIDNLFLDDEKHQLFRSYNENLYLFFIKNLLGVFINTDKSSCLAPNDLHKHFRDYKKQAGDLLSSLRNSYNKFTHEYVKILPQIRQEILYEDYKGFLEQEASLEFEYELYEDINEINRLLPQNTNNEKFYELLTIYNTPFFQEEISVLIANFFQLSIPLQKSFLHIFIEKLKTMSPNFSDIPEPKPKPLKECLYQYVRYQDILALTQIDFSSLSEDAWFFLKILPTVHAQANHWFKFFHKMIVEYLEDTAYTNIQRYIIDKDIP